MTEPTSTRALILRGPVSLTDVLSSILFDAGAGGVEVREKSRGVEVIAYCDAAEAARLASAVRSLLGELGRRQAKARKVVLSVEPVSDAWATVWTKALRPIRITKSFVVSTGSDLPNPEGKVIRLDPRLVFGYGEHPTTRLAAERLEAFCRAKRGSSVLDVGTGSGVLALVAALSGAGRVVGLDVDERAVRAARANAKNNNVAICHFSTKPLARMTEQFDCAVANLDRNTLLRLRPGLARVTAAGARVLLTGILDEDASSIRRAYAAEFDFVRRSDDERWVLLEFRKCFMDGRNATRARH